MHEDEALVLSYQKGDEQAIEVMYFKYLPFIKNFIQLFYLPYHDRDDRLQECLIVLYQAMATYDGSKKVTFFAYYKVLLDRHFYKLIRYQMAHKRRTEQTNHILEDYEVDNYAGLGYAQSLSPEEVILVRESFELSCEQLTLKERQALSKKYMDNVPLRQKEHLYRGVHKIKKAIKNMKSK